MLSKILFLEKDTWFDSDVEFLEWKNVHKNVHLKDVFKYRDELDKADGNDSETRDTSEKGRRS